MFFHDKGQHSVYYRDYERITNVLLKPSVTESMFTAWMSANQIYPEARILTYAQFVEKFVYVKKKRQWQPRQKGYTIGRLMWVPPTTGELYYLRMMLTITKGPTSYEDIKLVNGFQYLTYREACFAMGFLGDDEEYIAAISEAYAWGSGVFLRKLFILMLLSEAMDRPDHVWQKCWHWLCDGILYKQRQISQNQGSIFNHFLFILNR
jgi:hypothetical protein